MVVFDMKNKKNIPLFVSIGGYSLSNGDVGNYNSVDDLLLKLTEILNWAVGFAAVVAVALVIYSGYLFIVSTGDPDKISAAQKTLTAAVVGMVIVILSKTLVVFFLGLLLG